MAISLDLARSIEPLVKQVDEEFWGSHPEFRGRQLTMDESDRALRDEWNEILRRSAVEAVFALRDANQGQVQKPSL